MGKRDMGKQVTTNAMSTSAPAVAVVKAELAIQISGTDANATEKKVVAELRASLATKNLILAANHLALVGAGAAISASSATAGYHMWIHNGQGKAIGIFFTSVRDGATIAMRYCAFDATVNISATRTVVQRWKRSYSIKKSKYWSDRRTETRAISGAEILRVASILKQAVQAHPEYAIQQAKHNLLIGAAA